MFTGGYQIIDLKNTEFATGANVKVEGMYQKIKGTHKVVLVSGLKLSGVGSVKDFWASFAESGENLLSTSNGYVLTVTPQDILTVTVENPTT